MKQTAKVLLCNFILLILILGSKGNDDEVATCFVYEVFSKLDGECCYENVNCQSGCCLGAECVEDNPCPHYDESIEKWDNE